jgi:hypothetical protein
VEFQKNNYSCGIWSLYYIITRLNGVSCKNIHGNKSFNDKKVEQFRNKFFR